jgi:hypothetical protein
VFAGSVRFFGETREVDVILTDSEDALIGTNLLNHYTLAIEFPGAQVKVRPRRKTSREIKSLDLGLQFADAPRVIDPGRIETLALTVIGSLTDAEFAATVAKSQPLGSIAFDFARSVGSG